MQVRSISMNWKQAQRIENNVDRSTAMPTKHPCRRTARQSDDRLVTIAGAHPFKLLPASKPLYAPRESYSTLLSRLMVTTTSFRATIWVRSRRCVSELVVSLHHGEYVELECQTL